MFLEANITIKVDGKPLCFMVTDLTYLVPFIWGFVAGDAEELAHRMSLEPNSTKDSDGFKYEAPFDLTDLGPIADALLSDTPKKSVSEYLAANKTPQGLPTISGRVHLTSEDILGNIDMKRFEEMEAEHSESLED